MGIFGRKRDRILDLSKQYNLERTSRNQINSEEVLDLRTNKFSNSNSLNSNTGGDGFFGAIGNSIKESSLDETREYSNGGGLNPESPEEKRKKLTKRLLDMTQKIEELSNQVYHLQQRIEVLERKGEVGDFTGVFS